MNSKAPSIPITATPEKISGVHRRRVVRVPKSRTVMACLPSVPGEV
ncbi:hypothetical protein [Caulobacter sp. UC70_42]